MCHRSKDIIQLPYLYLVKIEKIKRDSGDTPLFLKYQRTFCSVATLSSVVVCLRFSFAITNSNLWMIKRFKTVCTPSAHGDTWKLKWWNTFWIDGSFKILIKILQMSYLWKLEWHFYFFVFIYSFEVQFNFNHTAFLNSGMINARMQSKTKYKPILRPKLS